MPQPDAGPIPTDDEIKLFTSMDEVGLRGAIEAAHTSLKRVEHQSGHHTLADHRSGDSELVSTLRAAVRSIPSYVERTTLMVVLAPIIKHADRAGHQTMDYRTWRCRGWCRMELACAWLARKEVPVLVARGGKSTPTFLAPVDCLSLPAGLGDFTCCTKGHDFGDGPGTARCDKFKVRAVLEEMIESKCRHLTTIGQRFESRFLACVKHVLLRGLPIPTTASAKDCRVLVPSALERLKLRLKWRDDASEKKWMRRTGVSLVWLATTANDSEAIAEALEACPTLRVRSRVVNQGLTQAWPHLSQMKRFTPLHEALLFSRWEVAQLLLNAGADPEARSATGHDALMCAALVGNVEGIRGWLLRFPDWNLERRDSIGGGTVLHSSVYNGPHCAETFQVLVDAGADPTAISDNGASCLHSAALNPDADAVLVRALLRVPELALLINHGVIPRTLKWEAIYFAIRLMFYLGRKERLVEFLANWRGMTALHRAAYLGNIDVVRALVREGNAEITRFNIFRLAALDVAELAYGGTDHVPAILSGELQR